MSSTGTPEEPEGSAPEREPEPGAGDDAADQAYFRALEEAFLALRGRTTLLGAEDWQVARLWRAQGIPAELVVAVMEALFARQRERRSKRGISSLRYFRAAVESEWEERLARLAGGARLAPELGPPVRLRLEALAAAVPDALPGAGQLRRELLELEGDPLEVEGGLERLDRGALAAAAAALDPEEAARIETRVERALGRVATAGSERELLAAQLRAQALRERFGLPLLSLFSPEALAAGEPPPTD